MCPGMLSRSNNSEFGGENKQEPVIPCALIVYSLRIWKDNHYYISCIEFCAKFITVLLTIPYHCNKFDSSHNKMIELRRIQPLARHTDNNCTERYLRHLGTFCSLGHGTICLRASSLKQLANSEYLPTRKTRYILIMLSFQQQKRCRRWRFACDNIS